MSIDIEQLQYLNNLNVRVFEFTKIAPNGYFKLDFLAEVYFQHLPFQLAIDLPDNALAPATLQTLGTIAHL